MRRFLIAAGVLLFAAGLFWPCLRQIGLGRLPGDIVINKGNFHLYFPLATCLVASVVLTLLFWLFRK
jgi:hypothetical protein